MFRCFLGLALLLALASSAWAHDVIAIADGDTLTLLVQTLPVKIRLANIDAPEKKQPFGRWSKQSLSDLCWQKDAQYEAQTIDHYGRTVAVVTCDGVEVNRAQVERGAAWVYTKYNKDDSLPIVQTRAKINKLGLWADSLSVPPWEWRRSTIKNQPN